MMMGRQVSGRPLDRAFRLIYSLALTPGALIKMDLPDLLIADPRDQLCGLVPAAEREREDSGMTERYGMSGIYKGNLVELV
jgi:hypothetical protein